MKINKEYSKNLKNKIITSDMLYDSIFSLNKRAKNCRDKKINTVGLNIIMDILKK